MHRLKLIDQLDPVSALAIFIQSEGLQDILLNWGALIIYFKGTRDIFWISSRGQEIYLLLKKTLQKKSGNKGFY